MKKFIIVICSVMLALVVCYQSYYRLGLYIDFHPHQPVTTFVTTDEDTIYMEKDGETVPFEIRGVNMGLGLPGKWATDYAIDKETYLRWFAQIQELGANTIRVYTILQDDFYNAFYEYNKDRDEPLYLIHGVSVNDYVQNSHRDAYDDDFRKALLDDSRILVDILHGNRNLNLGHSGGSGSYRNNVSPWVIGYILGVEWEDLTVAYTDHKFPARNSYQGTYLRTTPDASPFEAMLCEVGDSIIEYESKRYKEQRLVAFSNRPSTDPLDYPDNITTFFMKCAKVDMEHIQATDAFLSGQFASYHVYPYHPDYLAYAQDQTGFDRTADGRPNTYLTYLKQLTYHHTMPVVISEYGISTGRAMAHRDQNTGRNQGNMSEQEQGQALISCYQDIKSAGCAGSCVFTWQDEWYKHTWNTMHAVDLLKAPYWSDYQTNDQYFGLLSFDPGKEKSVCYVDGDLSEWSDEDVVIQNNTGSVAMKYDEKFLYFLIQKEDFSPETDTLYLPIDTTQKTGSTYCENYDLSFSHPSDFVIVIDGKENSRVLVQERYDPMRAMFFHETANQDAYIDPVDPDTPVFKPIELMLQTATPLLTGNWQASAETYETGRLTYGNANPDAEDFHSLADFIFSGDSIELKLPWQLLNFGNPAEMMIHDDYYEHYGVELIPIEELYIGITDNAHVQFRTPMESFPLKPWSRHVTYHERLKESYYMLQDYWSRH